MCYDSHDLLAKPYIRRTYYVQWTYAGTLDIHVNIVGTI